MEPRLDSSKKWTALPEEYSDKILEVLNENFKQQSEIGKFYVEGRIYQEEILIRLGYLANGRLVQANAEASCAYDFKKDKVQAIVEASIDAAGSMLDTYFTVPEHDFQRAWKSFTVNNREVFLQFSTVNTELEAEADRLLSELKVEDKLVKGDDDTEELESIKKMVGLEDEDDEPVKH